MDEELRPELNLAGPDADLWASYLDGPDQGPIPRATRPTVEEALANSVNDRQLLAEVSQIIPRGPRYAIIELMATMNMFIMLHAKVDGLGNMLLVGKERLARGIVDRLNDFLCYRVTKSQKLMRGTREPMYHKGTKNPVYCCWSTLIHWTRGILTMLPIFVYPEMNLRWLRKARKSIIKYRDNLRIRFHITGYDARRMCLYPIDIRGLIETIFSSYGQTYNLAVQDMAMLLAFMFTGCRPGSILKTARYPNNYSRWKHLVFRPNRVDGKTVSFDVLYTIVSFKGHNNGTPLHITFQIKATTTAKYALLDFGNAIIAHGLRRGVFGNRTLEDLLATDVVTFQCDTEYFDMPIFVARQSRTRLSDNRPLRDADANQILQNLMRKYGIASAKPGWDTLYATRKGFATTVSKHADKSIAKFFLGHEANSTMLEGTYDQGNFAQSMTGAVLGPGEESEAVLTPLAYTRSKNPVNMPKISLSEALERQPGFRHLATKRQFLEDCLRHGTSTWMRVEPYQKMIKNGALAQSDLPALIARYSKQLKTIVRRLRAADYEDQVELDRLSQEQLDYATVTARREEGDAPSALALDLQKRLIEQERKLVEADDVELDEGTLQVVIEPFDENDEEEEEDEDEDIEGFDGFTGQAGVNVEEDPLYAQEGEEDRPSKSLNFTSEQERRVNEIGATFGVQTANDNADEDPGVIYGAEELPKQKLEILRALVKLVDLEQPVPCSACLEDETASAVDKAHLWQPSFAHTRHMAQFHSDYAYGLRWMNCQTQNDFTFVCPFDTDQDDEACDFTLTLKDWRTRDRRGRDHLIDLHTTQLSDRLRPTIDQTTRAQKKAQQAAAVTALIGVRTDKPILRKHYELLLPGVFALADFSDNYLQSYGLGKGLDGTEDLSFETDAIPMGLLDDNGFLQLD